MRLKYLIPLIALLLTGCNNVSTSSSNSFTSSSSGDEVSYTDIDPSFEMRIVDSIFSNRHQDQDIGRVLNIKSTYSLFLDIKNKEAYPSPLDLRFEYDKNYLEIIDCVMDNFRSYPHFVWHLKPLQIVSETSINVFYLDKLYASYDLSVQDLSISPSSSASISKSLDSVSDNFPDEITIFKDLSSYENYFVGRKYFNYIKNQPTFETFTNYEYALIRVHSASLGTEPELNDAYIIDGTLYFDFKSTSRYFDEPVSYPMTTEQNYFLCLLRYPTGLTFSNYSIWLSVNYVE